MCLSLTEIPLSGIASFILLSCFANIFQRNFSIFLLSFSRNFPLKISPCNLSHHLNVASISGFCWLLRTIKIRKRVSLACGWTVSRGDAMKTMKTPSIEISRVPNLQLKLPHAILITAITTKVPIANLLPHKIRCKIAGLSINCVTAQIPYISPHFQLLHHSRKVIKF